MADSDFSEMLQASIFTANNVEPTNDSTSGHLSTEQAVCAISLTPSYLSRSHIKITPPRRQNQSILQLILDGIYQLPSLKETFDPGSRLKEKSSLTSRSSSHS